MSQLRPHERHISSEKAAEKSAAREPLTREPVARETVVRETAVRENVIRETKGREALAPMVAPPGTGIIPNPPHPGTNPLIEESWAVKESPLESAVARSPITPRTSEPTRISGPSFLGLSDGTAASDYLLDEETEDEERSTARSYVALALLLIFGVLLYKQWDNVTAFSRNLLHMPATAAATQVSSAPNAGGAPPVEETSPAPVKPESDEASPAETADEQKSDAAKPPADEAAAEEPAAAPPQEASAAKADEGAKAETKAERAATKEEAEPPAEPVYDDSQLELAQKYLQGRGVAQDCNRGISLLRSAAAQPNPKAQIKLGALYATGLCVERDRAQAYRWFAEAHQLQPGNQWIDKNLNSLWSEMTREERARVQR